MSHGYRPVQWTEAKRRYDAVLVLGIGVYLLAFLAGSLAGREEADAIHPVQAVIAATGSAAFLLLTGVLAIGPLARLDPRFLPLLYNRRHAGVAVFLLGLTHAAGALVWFHGFGALNPFVSILVSNPRYGSIAGFPFESLGFAALLILFALAATSHDFWNRTLGPRLWKAIHMSLYAAYALLAGHVSLGALQGEASPGLALAAALGTLGLAVLHGIAGVREGRRDRPTPRRPSGWVSAGPALAIPDKRAVLVRAAKGERIAVFRDGDRIFALSNVCRHQGGPLGEGRIVDGFVTCPWHGYQYRPEDGCSPPPFAEKVPTYRIDLRDGEVVVDPAPLPPGTPRPVLWIDPATGRERKAP